MGEMALLLAFQCKKDGFSYLQVLSEERRRKRRRGKKEVLLPERRKAYVLPVLLNSRKVVTKLRRS
nr:MAG: hypothetical protein [Bacteriophage sp.]